MQAAKQILQHAFFHAPRPYAHPQYPTRHSISVPQNLRATLTVSCKEIPDDLCHTLSSLDYARDDTETADSVSGFAQLFEDEVELTGSEEETPMLEATRREFLCQQGVASSHFNHLLACPASRIIA